MVAVPNFFCVKSLVEAQDVLVLEGVERVPDGYAASSTLFNAEPYVFLGLMPLEPISEKPHLLQSIQINGDQISEVDIWPASFRIEEVWRPRFLRAPTFLLRSGPYYGLLDLRDSQRFCDIDGFEVSCDENSRELIGPHAASWSVSGKHLLVGFPNGAWRLHDAQNLEAPHKAIVPSFAMEVDSAISHYSHAWFMGASERVVLWTSAMEPLDVIDANGAIGSFKAKAQFMLVPEGNEPSDQPFLFLYPSRYGPHFVALSDLSETKASNPYVDQNLFENQVAYELSVFYPPEDQIEVTETGSAQEPEVFADATESLRIKVSGTSAVAPRVEFVSRTQLVVGDANGTIWVYDLLEGETNEDGFAVPLIAYENGHSASVTAIASKGSRGVVASGAIDGSLTLWSAEAPEKSKKVTGITKAILDLRFSSSGDYLFVDIDDPEQASGIRTLVLFVSKIIGF